MDDVVQRRVPVDGTTMAVREAGTGDPIVLVHGNPTSSHLWRHVIPVLADHGRVLAPDLVGMGDSDKLVDQGPGSYDFDVQRVHLDALLQSLGVTERVVVVGHDWGGGLVLDWARRHAGAVRGVAFTEAVVRPRSWSEEDSDGQAFFRALRGPDGERMVLEDNVFVEEVLAHATRDLADADLEIYRRPWLHPGEDRRAMLAWPRAIPFDGEPADVHAVIAANAAWLETGPAPLLFVAAEPGAILTGDARTWCESLPGVTVATVSAGHFVPEDAGPDLAMVLRDWITTLDHG